MYRFLNSNSTSVFRWIRRELSSTTKVKGWDRGILLLRELNRSCAVWGYKPNTTRSFVSVRLFFITFSNFEPIKYLSSWGLFPGSFALTLGKLRMELMSASKGWLV